MSTNNPLERLAELAQDSRDAAGQLLAKNRQTQQKASHQFEALHRYRMEYADRLQDALKQGVKPMTLRNYQGFLGTLDDAIERARQQLSHQQHQVSSAQQQWQKEQRKLSSYNTLSSRRQDQQRQEQQRQEQRRNDEMSANSLARRQDRNR
ncbi:flagellar export protein FliJ [Pistricoccus aurantiacus]|uniref:Flagellar FliJ protein n=1 Tax=Pistricoccus aurantiacus TaxID=1883414 RepID=A0A5B8SRG1_9GAMM|nr:flagellar export protein FliJ [Pistricoccus aurantiacus]QEA39702.1 flagellar export protein FliJ [Pistricoccus aurantiacus]